jgi:transmembrane protein TMEM260 (protein O-mannosyltransferase)
MLRRVQGAAWVAALAALWAYALTLSPTVAWVNLGEDSGDLLAASATLGIPHPTGYPLFVLLGRLATFLPVGSIAFRINLVAAVAGAVSVYACARLAAALAPGPARAWAGAVAIPACALLYASSRGAWSQSVLAEVYTLNTAFLGLCLWLLVEAQRRGSSRRLLLVGYLFGLGLTNHLLILAALPPLLFVTWRLARTGKIGLAEGVLLPLLIFWGLTLDLFLPVRAARNPEFSWGVPATPGQLWWVLSGAQYARNFFARDLAGTLGHLVPGRWWMDFGWGLPLLAAGGAAAALRRAPGTAAAGLALLASVALLSAYSIADDVGYWMPAGLILAALAGAGWAWIAERSGGRVARAAVAGVLLAAVLLGFTTQWRRVDASQDLTPYVYAHRNLSSVEPDALIISEYDGRTFALWFYKATDFRKSHPGLVVAYKYLLVWPWYLHHLARTYRALSVPGYPGDLDLMMNRLVARNIRKRPVYLTRRDPGLLPLFTTRPVGDPRLPLYRVLEAGKTP